MPNNAHVSTAARSADILRAALDATGRSQVRLAVDVLGVNDRSLRGWLAGEPCWEPIVRLAWVLSRHPELADEIDAEYPGRVTVPSQSP